ncbi:MAG: hypothetical protein QOE54_6400 [Streptosporangiaceae bacterium]|jgi:hypothetical protein|nr:hypothetical protein [Streptosporangiaceae bacterium]MDX6434034.1 hypothetical protein [Streptosporangiaceae bacterium]
MAESQQPPSQVSRVADENAMGKPIEVFWMTLADASMFQKFTVVHVFDHGCVLSHHSKERIDRFRWDEVQRFTQRIVRKTVNGVYRSTTYTYEFELLDDRTVRVMGVTTRLQTFGVENFGNLADPLITAVQLPRMQAILELGHPVQFGSYKVESAGLRNAGLFRSSARKWLPWEDLQEVKVATGQVIVRSRVKRRRWSSAEVSSVPNLSAFLALVRIHGGTVA